MSDRFGLKFIDVMIGVILGLGFQWWPQLTSTWQYIAFIFVYLNLIDYWIDYSPTLKQYPLKNQFDVILHTAIMFAMFFLVYTTQGSIQVFLASFTFYRAIDIIWIWRMKSQYKPPTREQVFLNTWIFCDILEAIFCIILIIITSLFSSISPLACLIIFIVFRVASRAFASIKYKTLYYNAKL
jgi:predicted neutral ceramidase superfamily lipid hydrolase